MRTAIYWVASGNWSIRFKPKNVQDNTRCELWGSVDQDNWHLINDTPYLPIEENCLTGFFAKNPVQYIRIEYEGFILEQKDIIVEHLDNTMDYRDFDRLIDEHLEGKCSKTIATCWFCYYDSLKEEKK